MREREREGGLTSGAQEAPAHVDGRGEEAVPLGAAVVAADHDVVGEDHAACRHAAVPRVIGQRAADAAHQATWQGSRASRGQSQKSTTRRAEERRAPFRTLLRNELGQIPLWVPAVIKENQRAKTQPFVLQSGLQMLKWSQETSAGWSDVEWS